MTAASATVMALYLSSWLRSSNTLYTETVREAVDSALEAHARRNMPIEEALRLDCSSAYAAMGAQEHHGLLSWAQMAAEDYEAGRLPADPHHDDAPSSVAYKGIPVTWGDLRAAYEADLPDGGAR